jgi:hypothetical protein
MNDYIKQAVLKSTAQVWDGFWSSYPAAIILFIDIIERYPDSFTSLRARADYNEYLTKESLRIQLMLPHPKSDTLIERLRTVLKE